MKTGPGFWVGVCVVAWVLVVTTGIYIVGVIGDIRGTFHTAPPDSLVDLCRICIWAALAGLGAGVAALIKRQKP